MRRPRTDVCIFDRPIQRSCGHEQRYVCRLKNEQTRERRVAELMATPCRACALVVDVRKNVYVALAGGLPHYPNLAFAVSGARLEDLRRFTFVALSLLADDKIDVDEGYPALKQLARELFFSDKPAKSDTPR